LFEKDKLLFSFSMAFKLKLDAGLISHQELRFLMTGACGFSTPWSPLLSKMQAGRQLDTPSTA
jgi:hypothetical protein